MGVGVAGLPTTSTLTSGSAYWPMAAPGRCSILAFSVSRSLRSMPAAGRAPTSRQTWSVLEGDVRVVGGDHAGEQREGAVFEFHHDALTAFWACGRSSS